MVSYSEHNHRVSEVSNLFLLFKGNKVKVKKILLHPYYLDSLTEGSCDIALLELESPINRINPAKLNTKFNELKSDVVGVGYGVSGPADKPDLVGIFNKKIAGENTVDSIGGPLYNDYPTLMFCDFDHPNREDCNKLGNSTPKPLEYITSGGDSGGGLFRKHNEGWELIGICAGGGVNIEILMTTGYYGQIMSWTRTSVFKEWIDEVMR